MTDYTTLKDTVPPKLKSLLEKAAEFHSHLGPFLTIGVRMGIIGLQKIGKHDSSRLTITASLPLQVPFSCIIDGLQVSTNCTIGNQKLSLEDSETIQAKFRRKDAGREVIVALKTSQFELMKSELLKKGLSDEKVRELAWIIAGKSIDELFEITLKTRNLHAAEL
ncbi:MAG: formylmethanofuran dehydrogenase subunit E family protein [Candidatus Bathyarchaeota archaeon]|nr:MAG: formylmethanofuran dehydrogenase subunit E family protein [Candidatus Bathyarchaeota archaeon]